MKLADKFSFFRRPSRFDKLEQLVLGCVKIYLRISESGSIMNLVLANADDRLRRKKRKERRKGRKRKGFAVCDGRSTNGSLLASSIVTVHAQKTDENISTKRRLEQKRVEHQYSV